MIGKEIPTFFFLRSPQHPRLAGMIFSDQKLVHRPKTRPVKALVLTHIWSMNDGR